MKKHMPGFIPVEFYKVGKILLFPAAGLVVVGIAAEVMPMVIFGLALGLLSLYLIIIVPREE